MPEFGQKHIEPNMWTLNLADIPLKYDGTTFGAFIVMGVDRAERLQRPDLQSKISESTGTDSPMCNSPRKAMFSWPVDHLCEEGF